MIRDTSWVSDLHGSGEILIFRPTLFDPTAQTMLLFSGARVSDHTLNTNYSLDRHKRRCTAGRVLTHDSFRSVLLLEPRWFQQLRIDRFNHLDGHLFYGNDDASPAPRASGEFPGTPPLTQRVSRSVI